MVALIALMLLFFLLLQLRPIQTYVTNTALDTIEEKYDISIDIENVDFAFVKSLKLDNVQIKDNKNEILASINDAKVSISLFSLLQKKISLASVELNGLSLHVIDTDSISNIRFLTGNDNTESSSSSWEVDLEKLQLSDIDAAYRTDDLDLSLKLNQGIINVQEIDLSRDFYHSYHAMLRGLNLDIYMPKDETSSSTSILPLMPINLRLDDISVEDSQVSYHYGENRIDGFDYDHLDVQVGSLNGEQLVFETTKVSGHIKGSSISDTCGLTLNHIDLTLDARRDMLDADIELKTPTSHIDGTINATYKDIDAWLSDFNSQSLISSLSSVQISRQDLELFKRYLPDTSLDWNAIDGFVLSGDYSQVGRTMHLKNTKVNIPNVIHGHLDAQWQKHSNRFRNIQLAIHPSKVYKDGLSRLLPDLQLPNELSNIQYATIEGQAHGSSDSLTISQFSINAQDVISINAQGYLKDITNIQHLKYGFDQLHIDMQKDALTLDEDNAAYLSRLGHLHAKGSLYGSLHDFTWDSSIASDLGNAAIDITARFSESYNNANYQGDIRLTDFALDELLLDPQFGVSNGTITFSGSGLSLSDSDIDYKARIYDTYFKQHKYEQLTAIGSLKKGNLTTLISSQDPSTAFKLNGSIDLTKESIAFKGQTVVDSLDLYAMNIAPRPLKIGGKIESTLTGDTFEELEGELVWSSPILNTLNSKTAFEDSIVLSIQNKEDFKTVTLKGSLGSADITVRKSPDFLLSSIMAYINDHWPINLALDMGAYRHAPNHDQYIDATFDLEDINPLLTTFAGDHLIMDAISGRLLFDETREAISLQFTTDTLSYQKYDLNNLNINMQGDDLGIQLRLLAQRISSQQNSWVDNLNVHITGKDRKIEAKVHALDVHQKTLLATGASIRDASGLGIISLHDSLIINNSKWLVANNNILKFNDQVLATENFEIFRNNQSVKIISNKTGDKIDATIEVDRLKIEEIFKIIGREDQDFKGKITGNIGIKDIMGDYILTSNLKGERIKYKGEPVGTISLTADHTSETKMVKANFDMTGDKNDAIGDIQYNIESKNLGGYLEISMMQMKLIDPFLDEIISNSEGTLYGDFEFGGTLDRPAVTGNIHFDDASTVINASQTRYRIEDQKIPFDTRKILFNNINFTDEEGRVTTLNGRIKHNRFENLYLDLEASSNGAQFLNTTPEDNSFLYGTLFLNTNLDITGPPENITVSGFATAVNNSKLFMSPFSEQDEVLKDDFIVFNHPDSTNEASLKRATSFPVNVDIGVIVNEDSQFQIIMNPVTGDKLEGFGNANLKLKMLKNGTIDLKGDYTATKGKYIFSYGPITRKFKLQKGGTVQFSGDPLDAELKLNAVYQVHAAPYDLIKSEIDDNQKSYYANKMYFDVLLNLAGKILQPRISLDIQRQSDDSNKYTGIIDQKLSEIKNNPNELNNQVFGLLMLDSFLSSDNSIASIGSTEKIVLSSVSNLITNQLNSWTKGIKGVDINFGLTNYSKDVDNNASLVTEMNVGIAHQINDRISVSAGGNFGLESGATETKFARLAGNFIISYKLDKAGNYVIKFFNKNDINRLIDENNNKTGVSITIKKNLD